MRPIQFASNSQFDSSIASESGVRSHRPWASRAASRMVSALLVAFGTFTIFWLLANVTALLMVRG